MGICRICLNESPLISEALGFCVSCLRLKPDETSVMASAAHSKARRGFGLPSTPPKSEHGIPCKVCALECKIGENEVGYCGLRRNVEGRLVSLVDAENALLHYYTDPQITNCCAAWFCPAGTGAGYPRYACRNGPEYGYENLALFFYGCNFDCLFCQNISHKNLGQAQRTGVKELVDATELNDRISCWCFFGGSPEPQLPFAINASRKMLEAIPSSRILRICFEWNGCGNRRLVERAGELALNSGGNIKFDLKAHDPNLSIALSGVENAAAFSNFEFVYDEFYEKRTDLPILTATTLLVPGYVDAIEVERIAAFISGLDDEIPYSLLVFHPHHLMRDLPVTPMQQIRDSYRAAKKHLSKVNVGNLPLLERAEHWSQS